MTQNTIFNEDCFATMQRMAEQQKTCDIILTSPPYNTGKAVKGSNEKSVKNMDARYDIYLESKTDEEYIQWTIDAFSLYDKILAKNGVILYNLSYCSGDKSNGYKSTDLMWRVVAAICEKTPFTVADRIVWKKRNATPNNRSQNKLTRICEDVFVICRKDEYTTFNANKRVVSISNGEKRKGQKNYEVIYNFLEAPNNDGPCPLNKATFSSELCDKLLQIYAQPGAVIYDPFMGTGTTAVACERLGHPWIGSELSAQQCEWARKRISAAAESAGQLAIKL